MSSSLARSVLDGSEESRRVFIQDTVASNGRALLKFGVCQLASRYDEVHVLLLDISAQHWVKGLPPVVTGKLTLHDSTRELAQRDGSDLLSPVASTNHKTALVVDSLSFLLLRYSSSTLCRWLTSANHTHTLCLLHSDLHEGRVVSQMDYVATSILKVTTPLKVTAGRVSTTHRKPSGKILRQTESYFLSVDCASLTTTDSGLAKTSNAPSTVDPAANLTFDLHLSAKEAVARSQVVLPYTSAQEGEGLVAIESRTGRIFYEPDEEDCFGDSDPDDDLDI